MSSEEAMEGRVWRRSQRITMAEIVGGDTGLECPDCGCRHFTVISTEPRASGNIARRRVCRHCGKRVTTSERIIS